jgi:hypothetical protein
MLQRFESSNASDALSSRSLRKISFAHCSIGVRITIRLQNIFGFDSLSISQLTLTNEKQTVY